MSESEKGFEIKSDETEDKSKEQRAFVEAVMRRVAQKRRERLKQKYLEIKRALPVSDRIM